MEEIVYCRYTNNRSNAYKIKTIISIKDGRKRLIKLPASKDAIRHIENIYSNYFIMESINKNNRVKINTIKKIENGLEFEFINGKTFMQILNESLDRHGWESVVSKLRKFKEYLINSQEVVEFKETKEFKEVYGDTCINIPLKSHNIVNIDLLFDNIIINDYINICDYEWIFRFPIPINYVFYRSVIHYLSQLDHKYSAYKESLWNDLEISNEELTIYYNMECQFYNYVNRDYYNLHDLYNLYGLKQDVINIEDLLNTRKEHLQDYQYQVFMDYGADFNEQDSYKADYVKDHNSWITLNIPVPQNIFSLRIDPCSEPCIINIGYMTKYFGGVSESIKFTTNCSVEIDGIFAFPTNDPQIIIDSSSLGNAEHVELQFQIAKIPNHCNYRLVNILNSHRILLKEIEATRITAQKVEIQNQNIEAMLSKREQNIDMLTREISKLTSINQNLETVLSKREEDLQISTSEINDLRVSNQNLNALILEKEEILNTMNKELQKIYSTKTWKIANKFRMLLARVKGQ